MKLESLSLHKHQSTRLTLSKKRKFSCQVVTSIMNRAFFKSLLLCCLIQQQVVSAFVLQNRKATTFASASYSFPSKIVSTHKSATRIEGEDVKNEILDPLNKLMEEGNLSEEEINSIIIASDNLIEHLDEIESSSQYDDAQLRTAVSKMDVDAISAMANVGLHMDEETVEAAFWEVVKAVDQAEADDLPLSANITQMIHHVFDADMHHLLQREKTTTNVTCMQPAEETETVAGTARRMNYVFDDGDHKNLPLSEGRRCEGGM